ncbi:MAG: sodium/solute symporter [Armatimonadota bacterium]|nr:sodium/solute symporter [Armatimonadota bacterium]
MQSNFHFIDGAIIVVYLVILSAIGFYFSKRQKGIEDFFLARRSMAWFPVGLSLMAALNSGIDYIMQPSTIALYGIIFLAGTVSWIFLYPWVAYVSLPFFRRLNLYTAYQYLERRFDVRVRGLAATIFIFWRLGWLATALYAPCLAVNVATGGQLGVLPMIIVLGSVVTLYTMLGGIKAVIWTDVIQFCIMFGGLAATVAIVICNVPGGVPEILRTAASADKLVLFPPVPGAEHAGFLQKALLYLRKEDLMFAIILAAIVGRMAGYTCDQVMIQRFQTTKSVKDSRQAFIINAVGDALWMFGLGFVGLALFAYFGHHPMPKGSNPDYILPYFMSTVFPAGAVGLVIAAIFAASLSSIDSAINSCTSVFVVDFYNRLFLKRHNATEDLSPEEQRSQVRVSRMATVAFGIVGIILGANIGKIGPMIKIANKVIQPLTGPLLGLFLLGMFTKRARSEGALIGGIVGAGVSFYVAFGTDIGFIWPTVFGLVATLVIGYAVSLASGPPVKSQAGMTFKSVMKQPEVSAREEAVAD